MSHAVSELITSTILELLQLPVLKDFYLAGGTSLALRLNHRKSDDIDLFTNKIFGTDGLNKITEELISFYHPKEITINHINKDLDGQYQFLRAYIFEDGQTIKGRNMGCSSYIDTFAGVFTLVSGLIRVGC